MTYFFETYGCQMNKAESASVELLLSARNWIASSSAEEADVVIINTCSVRATAEERINGRLGWYHNMKDRRSFTLIVMGCMAERLHNSLKKRFKFIDYVVGTFQKQHMQDIFDAVERGERLKKIDEDPVYGFAPLSWEKGSAQAFVPIMHGCNNFCSYCIVPYVRGREISRSVDEILTEFAQLSSHGVKEVTLLGQNVNSYLYNGIDFPHLLELIAQHIRTAKLGIGWVRFMSSHPKDVSDDLIQVIAENRVLCRHIHLPVQSGSNAVLQAMNRKYSREHYLMLAQKIRRALPDASLSTDILIGFPGETEADFNDTVNLMKEVSFEMAFMYYYNPREGTAAFSFENQIDEMIKKERLARIIDMQLSVTHCAMEKRLGQTVQVLVSSVSRDNEAELLGRTEQDERIVFSGTSANAIGQFVNVHISGLKGNTYRGEIQEP